MQTNDEAQGRETKQDSASPHVKKVQANRSWLEIAPPQIITVDRSPRAAKLQLDTIEEAEEQCITSTVEYLVCQASDLFLKQLPLVMSLNCGEVAPPPFISVKNSKLKQLMRSKKLQLGTTTTLLDTILEESIHYAEHLVLEAADHVFRPLQSNVNSYLGNSLFSKYSWINNNNNNNNPETADKGTPSLLSSQLQNSNLLVQQAAAGTNLVQQTGSFVQQEEF
jgi:hypothetical protein